MSQLIEASNSFFAEKRAEARRVFHGRGQCYPGLSHVCFDWFAPVLLISAYKAIEGMQELIDEILAGDVHSQIESIVLQRRYEHGSPAEALHGSMQESLVVRENDLRFEVHPGRKQNAGLFMDMRLMRQWLIANSEHRRVLNLFAYTCSFSVAALAGGASFVTSVDLSKTSIAWGKRNHELNEQPLDRVKSIPYNLFTSWGRIKQYGRYDLVIIDPPPRQRRSFESEKNYGAVIKRLGSLCNPGADIIACLNSPFLDSQWMHDQFAEHCPRATFLERMPVAPEYPDVEPERGLKIFRFKFSEEPIQSQSN